MSESRIQGETYFTQKDLSYHRETYAKMSEDELFKAHLSNFLWNFPILKNYPGILGYEKIFKGVPAVMLGAGPSLSINMHLLKEYQKNVIIIAGDAVLPILVKKLKINPHFVVVGDPTEKQVLNFEDIDTTKFRTVCSSVTHPSIFRKVSPQHLSVYNVYSNSPLLQMIPYHVGRKGGLPAGVLTSGSVFMFAAMMGCDPITFMGHDLSWPSPDVVYADGVVNYKHSFQKAVKFKGDCLLFPDINGKLVLTHSTFINFYIWLRDSIQRIKTRVFNSSEAGILKMNRITPMSLEKWLKKYCQYELVGVEEKIAKAYEYQYEDGMVEKLLMPPLRVAQPGKK